MKKIFALLIVLTTFVCMANAQTDVMSVNLSDDTYVEYNVDEVESVTYDIYPWNLIGTGIYTFGDIYWTGNITGCELWQSSDDPTQWKIENWVRTDYPFTFTYDEVTGEVTVNNQDTGYYAYGYGENLRVDEANHYLLTHNVSGYPWTDFDSYYDSETDTFYFAVVYYISQGYFGFSGFNDAGYETFVFATKNNVPARKNSEKKLREKELQINAETKLVPIEQQ